MRTLHHLFSRFVRAALVLGLSLFGVTPAFAAHHGQNGRIAFLQNLTGSNQIYTVNLDGTGLFQVTNLPPANDGFALWPDFAPTASASSSRTT